VRFPLTQRRPAPCREQRNPLFRKQPVFPPPTHFPKASCQIHIDAFRFQNDLKLIFNQHSLKIIPIIVIVIASTIDDGLRVFPSSCSRST
jgi:hypothetical protein